MAFTAINSSEIEVGDPLKKELFDKIKNNLDDHETRIGNQETIGKRVVVFDLTVKNAASASSFTGLAYSEATLGFTITSCEIRIFEKGSLTGSLEVDIKKSTGVLASSSFTSIFTTKPKLTMASVSNYARSTNQAFSGSQINISAGDTLRLDVTEMPTNGVMGKFRVLLYGEV